MSNDHLLDIYLEDITPFALLDQAQEIALGRRIQAGDQAARMEMIQANLRLVIGVARAYEHLGLPLLDVIAEGNIGLMRAVERFDPDMGYRFSTYGVHWIRQGIRRAISNQGRSVRVPAYLAELVSRWRRWARDAPDPEDIDELMRALRLQPSHRQLVERVLAIAHIETTTIGSAEFVAVCNELPDNVSDPEAELLGREQSILVRECLARVPVREAEILRLRFGIEDYPVLTLEEIGEIFSLTRERIRQIEQQALERLRSMIPSDVL